MTTGARRNKVFDAASAMSRSFVSMLRTTTKFQSCWLQLVGANVASSTIFLIMSLDNGTSEKLRMLFRARATYPVGREVEALGLAQFDELVQRLQRSMQFDPDDVDAALSELDSMCLALDDE